MAWQKHTYMCTECDSQIEMTSYIPEADFDIKCPCEHQAIKKISTYELLNWGQMK